VRYTVSVIVNRRFKCYLKYDARFEVVKQTDLQNQHPELFERMEKQITTTFRNFLEVSAPMTMKVSMPMTCFVAGEDSPITVKIDNPTQTAIDGIEIKLFKVLKCKWKNCMGEGYQDFQIPISQKKYSGEVVNGTMDYYTSISIPELIPSTLTSNEILDICYEIRVAAMIQLNVRNAVYGLFQLGNLMFPTVKFFQPPSVDIPIVIDRAIQKSY
jgi:hypothetical protein